MDAAAHVALAATTKRHLQVLGRRCLRWIVVLTVNSLGAELAARTIDSTQSRPNVIVMLSDDQGWGDFSLQGNTNLATPNLDALAHGGARFERFFVCPVCSPTRAEFLTGRYHPRGGVQGTSAGGERLNLQETTIAELFQAAGYATAAFGKWHNGTQGAYHPNARGFTEFYGFCSGHWGHYFDPLLEHNNQLVRGHGYVSDDFTDHALAFIEAHQQRPFFVYVAYNTPHSPMQVPDRWWERLQHRELAMSPRDPAKESTLHTRAALAMCENLDWNVGRIMNRLRDLQLTDNTMVVYFCDNGPNGHRWNGDMKGIKGSTDEGGVRSPLFLHWPTGIRGGTNVTPITAAIDLLPTLADLAGVSIPDPLALDGLSLRPLLEGSPADWPDRTLFSHWQGRVSARTQQYRLDHQGNLFDLASDPGQRLAINDTHATIAKRLAAEVTQWKRTVGVPLPADTRPFPVGDSRDSHASRVTQLPARDAETEGNVTRSNRYPNCSFLTNWTHRNDRITWDVEVAEAGDYQVELHYTCDPADIGSKIELSFEDQHLRATVSQPYESPLIGASEDRVKRIESYVKNFSVMNIGVIRLPQHRGPLTLSAIEIAGQAVMDVRLLVLTRVEGVSKEQTTHGTP